VTGGADAAAASEELDASNVHAVDRRAVVCEKGGEGTAVDFGAVDYRDCFSVEAVSVRQDRVIDLEVLEGFDDGERGAWQNGFLEVGGGVEESDVVIHVEEVGVAEPFDVL